ncbi:MAG: hypothetical protein K2X53_01520 [Alphaproteobacteria bacterium]|nr:hypothetical protein [Alphaproteobacteria bacterium]
MKRTLLYGIMFFQLCSGSSNHAYSCNLTREEPKKMKRFFVKTGCSDHRDDTLYYELRDKGGPVSSSKALNMRAQKKSHGVKHFPAPIHDIDEGKWVNYNSLISSSSLSDLGESNQWLEGILSNTLTMDLEADSPFEEILMEDD